MLRSAATLPASGTGTYHHHDGLGSVIMLTNAGGSVVERYRYDVFGSVTILDAAHAPRPATAHNNRFLFTGREWLAELELYDYRNRTYSPHLGRFLQTDPIRFDAGDANLHRYVFNSSVLFTDFSGLAVAPEGARQSQSSSSPNWSPVFNPNQAGGNPWRDGSTGRFTSPDGLSPPPKPFGPMQPPRQTLNPNSGNALSGGIGLAAQLLGRTKGHAVSDAEKDCASQKPPKPGCRCCIASICVKYHGVYGQTQSWSGHGRVKESSCSDCRKNEPKEAIVPTGSYCEMQYYEWW